MRTCELQQLVAVCRGVVQLRRSTYQRYLVKNGAICRAELSPGINNELRSLPHGGRIVRNLGIDIISTCIRAIGFEYHAVGAHAQVSSIISGTGNYSTKILSHRNSTGFRKHDSANKEAIGTCGIGRAFRQSKVGNISHHCTIQRQVTIHRERFIQRQRGIFSNGQSCTFGYGNGTSAQVTGALQQQLTGRHRSGTSISRIRRDDELTTASLDEVLVALIIGTVPQQTIDGQLGSGIDCDGAVVLAKTNLDTGYGGLTGNSVNLAFPREQIQIGALDTCDGAAIHIDGSVTEGLIARAINMQGTASLSCASQVDDAQATCAIFVPTRLVTLSNLQSAIHRSCATDGTFTAAITTQYKRGPLRHCCATGVCTLFTQGPHTGNNIQSTFTADCHSYTGGVSVSRSGQRQGLTTDNTKACGINREIISSYLEGVIVLHENIADIRNSRTDAYSLVLSRRIENNVRIV